MTATAFSPASSHQMYSNTSLRVETVVQKTERVGRFYIAPTTSETKPLIKNTIKTDRVFDIAFIESLTQECKDLGKLTQLIFLNDDPFTPKSYREAREAHEVLTKSMDTLKELKEIKLDITSSPFEIQAFVKAVREFAIILNKCHKHLSNRFDALDKRGADAQPSKYLRRVTGSERWNLRPSVYEYQV
jgi:hypothetical protein